MSERTVPGPLSVEYVVHVMEQTMVPHTHTVQLATNSLNNILKQAECVPIVHQLLRTSPNEQIRQLSGVVLRKKIVRHWGRLPEDFRVVFQRSLLEAIATDPSPSVRRAVGELVASIARLSLPTHQWPELLPFLYQCATNTENSILREVGLKLFGFLNDIILEPKNTRRSLKHQIFSILAAALKDPKSTPEVLVSALGGVSSMMQWLTERDVNNFRQELLPHVIQAMRLCVSQNWEDTLIEAFEIFDDLVETPTKSVSACIPVVISFSLEVAKNVGLDLATRVHALTFIEWVARFKPESVIKYGSLEDIMSSLVPLLAEEEPEEEEVYDDESSTHAYAAELLDIIAQVMPSRLMWEKATPFLPALITSPHAPARKAALSILAVLSEYCFESMKESMEVTVQYVYSGLQDSDYTVRAMACITMGQFSEYLNPDIYDFHEGILPRIFHTLSDPSLRVQRKSCLVVQMFADQIGSTIVPYLPNFVEKLVNLIMHGSDIVKDAAALALSSAAVGAKKDFYPYFPQVSSMMQHFMTIKPADSANPAQARRLMALRGRATQCMGSIIGAMGGKDDPALTPFINISMQAAIDAIHIAGTVYQHPSGKLVYNEEAEDEYSYDLREMSFTFFSDMSHILQEHFSPFLPTVVPLVLGSCESVSLSEVDVPASSPPGVIEIESDDEDSETTGVNPADMQKAIFTSYVEEKSSACFTLGALARDTKKNFAPYVERSALALFNQREHVHPDVRSMVYFSLPYMVLVLKECSPSGVLDPFVRSAADKVMQYILNLVEEEEFRDVVIKGLDSLTLLIKELDAQIVLPLMPLFQTTIMTYLKREAACQDSIIDQYRDAWNDDEDYESSDDEAVYGGEQEIEEDKEIELMEMVSDMTASLAELVGEHVIPIFQEMLPHVLKLMKPSNSHYYKMLALAVIGDVIRHTRFNTSNLIEGVFPYILQGLKDKHQSVKQNAAYSCGHLILNAGQKSVNFHVQALQELAPLVGEGNHPSLRDNSISAIIHIMNSEGFSVPFVQIVPSLLANLPLREDFKEGIFVYPGLIQLVRSHSDQMTQFLEQLVAVLRQAESQYSERTREEVAAFLASLPTR